MHGHKPDAHSSNAVTFSWLRMPQASLRLRFWGVWLASLAGLCLGVRVPSPLSWWCEWQRGRCGDWLQVPAGDISVWDRTVALSNDTTLWLTWLLSWALFWLVLVLLLVVMLGALLGWWARGHHARADASANLRAELRAELRAGAGAWACYALVWVVCCAHSVHWLATQTAYRLPLAHDRTQGDAVLRLLSVETDTLSTGITRVRVVGDVLSFVPTQTLHAGSNDVIPPRRVQLSWYPKPNHADALPTLVAGAVWSVHAVLRAPRNYGNPLAFDYEAGLLQRGIDATGWVKRPLSDAPLETPPARSNDTRLISQVHTAWNGVYDELNSMRRHYLEQLDAQLTDDRAMWVKALVFGQTDALPEQVWWLARRTGTSHLWVVSGLHVGLIALFVWCVWRWLRRGLSVVWQRSVLHQRWLWLVVLLASTAAYAWLAGWGVSVQRAWWMLLLAALIWWGRVPVSIRVVWALALVVLLWLNPLATTQVGFVLSFAAVGALVWVFDGRQEQSMRVLGDHAHGSRWSQGLSKALSRGLLPQWVVFVCLMPVLALWLLGTPWVALLANAVAIPWLSFVLLPATLLLALACLPNTDAELASVLVSWLASTVAWLGEHLLLLLNWLAFHVPMILPTVSSTQAWCLVALVLVGLLAGASGWRVLALLVVTFALCVQRPQPSAQAVLIDVGQGLSLVIITEQASLLYDTGTGAGSGFDAGRLLVAPSLRQWQVSVLDALVVSHSDSDHAGGLDGVLGSGISVREAWVGQPLAQLPHAHNCHTQPAHWQRLGDQLALRVLAVKASGARSDNNWSCVVQVKFARQVWLLTGDIDRHMERTLVDVYGDELKSDVLLVAHHGSKSSSSDEFLAAVGAQTALVSAGFGHRYGHPHSTVVARLRAHGMKVLNTAEYGQIRMDAKGQVHTHCQHGLAYWHQGLCGRAFGEP